jgi:hypothetical protein
MTWSGRTPARLHPGPYTLYGPFAFLTSRKAISNARNNEVLQFVSVHQAPVSAVSPYGFSLSLHFSDSTIFSLLRHGAVTPVAQLGVGGCVM